MAGGWEGGRVRGMVAVMLASVGLAGRAVSHLSRFCCILHKLCWLWSHPQEASEVTDCGSHTKCV